MGDFRVRTPTSLYSPINSPSQLTAPPTQKTHPLLRHPHNRPLNPLPFHLPPRHPPLSPNPFPPPPPPRIPPAPFRRPRPRKHNRHLPYPDAPLPISTRHGWRARGGHKRRTTPPSITATIGSSITVFVAGGRSPAAFCRVVGVCGSSS